jgi:hypothetical protein
MTTRFEIHPSVGIARLGTSEKSFIGPEPGQPPPASYRDEEGALLRQAARFRVFECERDDHHRLVSAREVTIDDATITWTVHLVNRKATGTFGGVQRNAHHPDPSQLVIDPGARSVTVLGQGARFDTGQFKRAQVFLGDIATNEDGSVTVQGGHGKAGSEPSTDFAGFANNDNWWDDTSDGPVTAVVRTVDGAEHEATSAWVIVGPPDFAPPIINFVTLYDLARDVAVEQGWLQLPQRPSFTRDVYPILSRPYGYSWVCSLAVREHRKWGPTSSRWPRLADPDGDAGERQDLLAKLRKPGNPPGQGSMPRLNDETIQHVLPPSVTQYEILERWAAGSFVGDWGQDTETVELLPDALDRVALQAGSGGAFFPGIEASSILADKKSYSEPFRLDAKRLAPGAVTQVCAVPWQADFIACTLQNGRGWWPSQRPDDVYRDPADVGGKTSAWARGIRDPADMVANWHQLGVVVEKSDPAGQPVYVETERRLPEPEDGGSTT